MSGMKISSLNNAIREAIPLIRQTVDDHPEVELFMRAIAFSDTAEWHVGPQPMSIDQFYWSDLGTHRTTNTAAAIDLLSLELDITHMPSRGFPPVIILVSDGYANSPAEYEAAIARMCALPWGKKAVRIAIAMGSESDYDEQQLSLFVSHSEIGVLKAHNVSELVQQIRWASTVATAAASRGKSAIGGNQSHGVMLPVVPQYILQIQDDSNVF